MGFEDFDVRSTLLRYRRRYVCALLGIALLALCTFLSSERMIDNQREDGVRINIAGRQRMLSQRLALLVTMHQVSPNVETRATLRAEIVQMKELFARSHRALLSGDPGLGLEQEEHDAVFYEIYLGDGHLDDEVVHFLGDLTLMSAVDDEQLVEEELVQRIYRRAMVLLPLLDQVTRLHEERAIRHIKQLYLWECLLFCLMCGGLALEACLIFWPMEKAMGDQLRMIKADGIAMERAARRMRSFLDVTDDGVVSVTGEGCFAEIHNAQFERWFGPVSEGADALGVLFSGDRDAALVQALFAQHGKRNHLIPLVASLPTVIHTDAQVFTLCAHYIYEPEPRVILILKDRTSHQGFLEVQDTLVAKELLFEHMLQTMRAPLDAVYEMAMAMRDTLTPQARAKGQVQGIIVLTRQLMQSVEEPVQLSEMKGGEFLFVPSVFVLDELLDEILESLSPAIALQHNVVQRVVEPGLSTVYSDRGKVFYLLMSLLSSLNTLIDGGVLRVIARTQHNTQQKGPQKRLICEVVCRNKQTFSMVKKRGQKANTSWRQLFVEGAHTDLHRKPEMLLTQKLCQALGAELHERSDDVEGLFYRLTIPINQSAARGAPPADTSMLKLLG